MMWDWRLEQAAYASLFLSMLSSIGDAPPYNCAISLLMLFAQYTRRGRHVLIVLIALFLSCGLDMLYLGQLNLHDKNNIVTLLCIAMLFIAKIIGIVASYKMFMNLGGTWSLVDSSIPVEGTGRESMDRGGSDRRFSEISVGTTPGGGGGGGGGGSGSYRDSTPAGFYSPTPMPMMAAEDGNTRR